MGGFGLVLLASTYGGLSDYLEVELARVKGGFKVFVFSFNSLVCGIGQFLLPEELR